jgi:hypothetical protein
MIGEKIANCVTDLLTSDCLPQLEPFDSVLLNTSKQITKTISYWYHYLTPRRKPSESKEKRKRNMNRPSSLILLYQGKIVGLSTSICTLAELKHSLHGNHVDGLPRGLPGFLTRPAKKLARAWL